MQVVSIKKEIWSEYFIVKFSAVEISGEFRFKKIDLSDLVFAEI